MEGNVVVGGGAAFSWVNIDGGIVHHNLVQGPAPWVMRILNENEGSAIVVTKNGQFHDNEVAFATGGAFNSAVNVGDGTEPETFQFARNHWLNLPTRRPTARARSCRRGERRRLRRGTQERARPGAGVGVPVGQVARQRDRRGA